MRESAIATDDTVMPQSAPQALVRAEYYILLLLCFVLPILEAPKNIALVLLLLLLLVRLLAFERPGWRPLDTTEKVLVLLVVASIVSTAVNWPIPNREKGAKDMFANAMICWRSGAARRWRLLLLAATAALVGVE